MIRGLRWRLTLAIVLITLAASTVVGVGLGRFTTDQFEAFLEVEEEGPELGEEQTFLEEGASASSFAGGEQSSEQDVGALAALDLEPSQAQRRE